MINRQFLHMASPPRGWLIITMTMSLCLRSCCIRFSTIYDIDKMIPSLLDSSLQLDDKFQSHIQPTQCGNQLKHHLPAPSNGACIFAFDKDFLRFKLSISLLKSSSGLDGLSHWWRAKPFCLRFNWIRRGHGW